MANKEIKCKSCSKEIIDRVPIIRVIEKLDALLSKNDVDGAVTLLKYWENEARNLSDRRGLLEILNEEIGIYRQNGDSISGLKAVEEAFKIIEEENLSRTVSAGTMLINGATTMKAFGKPHEAIPYYEKAMEIFCDNHMQSDFKFAALCNNMASAFTEIGEYENAEEKYRNAIDTLKKIGNNDGEIAVSYVNLAHLYHEQDIYDERIPQCMDTAWEYLKSDKLAHDGNYAFICSKCAPSFGFFGYFLQKAELQQISEEIYGRD